MTLRAFIVLFSIIKMTHFFKSNFGFHLASKNIKYDDFPILIIYLYGFLIAIDKKKKDSSHLVPILSCMVAMLSFLFLVFFSFFPYFFSSATSLHKILITKEN